MLIIIICGVPGGVQEAVIHNIRLIGDKFSFHLVQPLFLTDEALEKERRASGSISIKRRPTIKLDDKTNVACML